MIVCMIGRCWFIWGVYAIMHAIDASFSKTKKKIFSTHLNTQAPYMLGDIIKCAFGFDPCNFRFATRAVTLYVHTVTQIDWCVGNCTSLFVSHCFW